jgi:hypothetical protein
VGLADSFQPSVKVSCVGGTMKIRVDTLKPFQGIIHGPNRTEPGCSMEGNSGLKTFLNIDLTRPSGTEVRTYYIVNYFRSENYIRLSEVAIKSDFGKSTAKNSSKIKLVIQVDTFVCY